MGIHVNFLRESGNCNNDMLVEFHVSVTLLQISPCIAVRVANKVAGLGLEAKWQAGCFEGTQKHLRRISVSCSHKRKWKAGEYSLYTMIKFLYCV